MYIIFTVYTGAAFYYFVYTFFKTYSELCVHTGTHGFRDLVQRYIIKFVI